MIEFKDPKKLKKFLGEFGKRQDEFKKLVMKSLAEDLKKQVQMNAPNTVELGNYADSLKAVSVDHESSAVLYFGKDTANAKNLDADTILLTLLEVKTEKPIASDVFEILKVYEPFTLKSFPSAIDLADFVFDYKKVPQKTVLEVFNKNKRDSVDLARELKALSIVLDPKQFEIDEKDQAMPNITFQVLQHEFNLKRESKPHWKPALNNLQRKGILGQLKLDRSILQTLFDPDYNIKEASSKMSLNVDSQSVQSTTDFMKYLGKGDA